METSLERVLSLDCFAVHTLTYVPELNNLLASNGHGEVASIDVVTGAHQKCLSKLKPRWWYGYVCACGFGIIIGGLVISLGVRGLLKSYVLLVLAPFSSNNFLLV